MLPLPVIACAATAVAVPLPVLVAAGLAARMLGIGAAAGGILPGVPGRVRLAAALACTVVALPAALAAHRLDPAAVPADVGLGGVLPILLGELAVGLGFGAAVAALSAAGAAAGGILGGVAGLSWAADGDPAGDGQSAAGTRLAWWLSCGVFLAGGGLGGLVAGVVDGVRVLPVGAAFAADGLPRPGLEQLAAVTIGLAFALALTVAVPAVLAVVAFHLAAALALRTVPFVPGPGLLEALAAAVLLAALSIGADGWVHGFPSLLQGPLERIFGAR